ncbi:MFS transporter [Vreelandella venusta]|uniref:MFS transporter n=1 Tax=Vreelandella venusta TaxID=44935 RepID=UPI00116ADF10|nr:MFS transporter [Halomonas venusta]GEK51833.1 hypothetical protein HVE01_25540 [Halomonas venusta]
MTQSKTPFIVVLSLALTMMLGPFSMDTYLPAFPVIGESLGVSQQAVSLSVSVYVFAMAFGQLIGGALSDRFGRQRVLMSGLAIFALSSIVIGMADSLNTLLGGRAVQALGAGFTLVSVPALVRDRVAGRDAAKLFSMMGFIMVLAPGTWHCAERRQRDPVFGFLALYLFRLGGIRGAAGAVAGAGAFYRYG